MQIGEFQMTEKEYAEHEFRKDLHNMLEYFTVADIQEIVNEEIGSKDKGDF